MSNWQLIETAPKDGTEFIVFDATSKKMDVCHWYHGRIEQVTYEGEYGPSWGEFNGGDYDYEKEEYIEPLFSHWMPLPVPPVETEKAK